MRTLIYLALALCAVPALAQPEADAPIFPMQPERAGQEPRLAEVDWQISDDLRDFALVFNNVNSSATPVYNGYDYVYNSRAGIFGAADWARQVRSNLRSAQLVIDDVRDVERDGDSANALVVFHFKFPDYVEEKQRLQGELPREERVQFKLAPLDLNPNRARWKMVPPDVQPPALSKDFAFTTQAELNFWANVAYYSAQKQAFAPADLSERSLQNLKTLNLGVLQLLQDYDETFAFDAAHLIDAVSPYVAGSPAFQVPGTNEIYTFNAHLSGFKQANVDEVYQTVLFYEGQNEQPIFRYNGKAAIGFADGHAALVSPEEAKKMIWKP